MRKTSEVWKGSFQGTAVFQYKTKEQAKRILDELISRNRHMIGGKLLLADVAVYEYQVDASSADREVFLADPEGRQEYMRPLDGPNIRWYTN